MRLARSYPYLSFACLEKLSACLVGIVGIVCSKNAKVTYMRMASFAFQVDVFALINLGTLAPCHRSDHAIR